MAPAQEHVFARDPSARAGTDDVDAAFGLIGERLQTAAGRRSDSQTPPAGSRLLPGNGARPGCRGWWEQDRLAGDGSRGYSVGELPRSKPAIFTPPPFAAEQHLFAGQFACQTQASSTSRQGITSRAPAARAVATVVVARSTSMTTQTLPASSADSTSRGRRWTLMAAMGVLFLDVKRVSLLCWCHCWLVQQCWKTKRASHCWTSQQWHPAECRGA